MRLGQAALAAGNLGEDLPTPGQARGTSFARLESENSSAKVARMQEFSQRLRLPADIARAPAILTPGKVSFRAGSHGAGTWGIEKMRPASLRPAAGQGGE